MSALEGFTIYGLAWLLFLLWEVGVLFGFCPAVKRWACPGAWILCVKSCVVACIETGFSLLYPTYPRSCQSTYVS